MSIRILTDSASDILPEEAERLGITLIPLIVNINGVEYHDSYDISHHDFYARLVASEKLPTTSQISPAVFEAAFRKIVEEGDTVVAIVLSSVLSGTYQSACIAAAEFPGKVFVVDSLNATVGERMLVMEAVQLQAAGAAEEQIVAHLEKARKEIRLMALLDTLEYLKKGGRISAATAFAGGLLSIKPVIAIQDGAVVVVGKARGSKNGNNQLRKMITESRGINFDRPFYVAYTGQSDELLQAYIRDSADLWQTGTQEVPVCTVGSVIGTHIGPGAIAVAYFEKD